jgi:hypothetical protein
MIQTPGHGAYPSGHATEAFAVAHLLSMIAPPQTGVPMQCAQLMRQASRVAVNRTVAGVHFPVDSAAGQFLGLALGEYFVASCKGNASIKGHEFLGDQFGATSDFDFTQMCDVTQADPAKVPFPANLAYMKALAAVAIGAAPKTLAWLWAQASNEWT